VVPFRDIICAGRPASADYEPNSQDLTKLEGDVIIEHILKLFDQVFAPRLAAVADMAHSLRTERNMGHIGSN
jgi:hypothetical protein